MIQNSGLFDAAWYLDTYPDVAEAGVDALGHFLTHGAGEGRDPGPGFSVSGYRLAWPECASIGENPVLHYLRAGKPAGFRPLSVLTGEGEWDTCRQSVLVCGHLAGRELFGAERSLLDVLSALGVLGFNVIAALPGVGAAEYFESVRARVGKVVVLPYRWWRAGRPACSETVESFAGVVRQFQVDVVHLNTLVLLEPALAARQCGVPVVVHARELPEHDEALCKVMNAAPDAIRDQVLSLADHVIANSGAVARYFGIPERVSLVNDCLDATSFDISNDFEPAVPRVGMISSNLPKKGLTDFVELARLLEAHDWRIRCILIGPENPHVDALRAERDGYALPGNIEFAGYAEDSLDAVRQAHVVVNLSRVQESFGRTVLEAMAARRPVVCYDWGALRELVVDGETGYLAPFGDIAVVAARVRALFEQPELLVRFGEAGRMRAVRHFGPEMFRRNLALTYAKVLRSRPVTD